MEKDEKISYYKVTTSLEILEELYNINGVANFLKVKNNYLARVLVDAVKNNQPLILQQAKYNNYKYIRMWVGSTSTKAGYKSLYNVTSTMNFITEHTKKLTFEEVKPYFPHILKQWWKLRDVDGSSFYF